MATKWVNLLPHWDMVTHIHFSEPGYRSLAYGSHLLSRVSTKISEKSSLIFPWRLLGLALLTLSWDKNWDSHSLVNGNPSFYHRIALVAPSPGQNPNFQTKSTNICFAAHVSICRINYRRTQMHTHTHRHTLMILSRPTYYSTDFTSNWTDSRSQNYTC